MKKRKLILWRLGAGHMPQRLNDIKALDIDYAGGDPALLDHLGAEWRVVSHTVTVLEDGGFLLSLYVEADETL